MYKMMLSGSSSKSFSNNAAHKHNNNKDKIIAKLNKYRKEFRHSSKSLSSDTAQLETPEVFPIEAGSYHNGNSSQRQELSKISSKAVSTLGVTVAEETDLSADNHTCFAEARSTPIIYSTESVRSSSSSSVDDHPYNKAKKGQRAGSLCSARSFSIAHQNQDSNASTHSSTQNQTFYFGTPLPPQKHHPYQYHDPTTRESSYYLYGDESNTPPQQRLPTTPATTSSSFLKRKKDMFLQSNSNRRLSATATSIKSTLSTGRQTIRSWRQKRINSMMKQQHLPEFETKAFCEDCEKYIQTRIRYKNGSMVWLVSFTLLLCTVILFWVPFYVKYFKDVAHFCPGCGKRLGVSYRL